MTLTQPDRRGGFTFIEVMFAVILLGVGVVMIATMLPVAIKTVQDTREGAAGTAGIESGFHLVEQSYAELGPTSMPPTPNNVVATWPSYDLPAPPPAQGTGFRIEPFIATFGNRVNSADPRYMWLPFYSRSSETDPPQVALVGVRARNIEAFPPSPNPAALASDFYSPFFDVDGVDTGINLDNYPLPVFVETVGGSGLDGGVVDPIDLDQIRLEARNGSDNRQIRQAATAGAAVVVVDNVGRLKVYRLNEPLTEADADPTVNDATVWTLAPDAALDPNYINNSGTPNDSSDDYNDDAIPFGSPVAGYLVGRMLNPDPADPAAPWDPDTNPYVGPSPVVQTLDGQQVR